MTWRLRTADTSRGWWTIHSHVPRTYLTLWEAGHSVVLCETQSFSLGFYTEQEIMKSKREHVYPVSPLLFLEGSDS